MDLKNIGAIVGGIVIGVILLTTLLVPIVSTSLITAGDVVEYDNPIGNNYTLSDYSSELVFERDSSGVVTVNDETISNENSGFVIATDGISIYYAFGGRLYFVDLNSAIADYSASSTVHITVEYSDGVGTFTNLDNNTTVTAPYTWMYVYTQNGDYDSAYFNSRGYYVNSINDVVCTGYYGSGENDTGYTLKDGILTLSEDFESSVTYDLELVEGTTDIYTMTNLKIHVGEEEFTPWVCLVPATISGHSTSGALYSMLDMIPLLVTVGIIMAVVMWAFARRE